MADERKVAFNWYLNRQGPRGPQGVKGDTGFSPNITVETDNLNEYILRITNEGGYFLTSNLREHKEDRGGTYIRYDRDSGVMYAGEADVASDTKAGMIKIATAEDVEAEDESTAVTPAILADYMGGATASLIDDATVSTTKVWSSEKTSQSIAGVSNQVATNTTDISNIKTALPNKQNKLIAGDNITIVGDTISSTAGGDVTLAGDNSFTGKNTFSGETKFKGHTLSLEQEAVNLNVTSNATLKNAYVTGTLSSLGELTAVSISAAGIKNNQNNKYYLNQASITAGNNITVEETTEGVKISSSGGASAGLEGDYCSKYGIVDCPNGILEEGTKKVTLKAGVVMQMTETDGLTTNASDMSHDITSTVDFDLFYTSGSLLEATQVVFSTQEPEDGATGVLAWYNGAKWQFKSNDAGNVWRTAPAVRLAHIHITDGNITRIDYIGNRHLNKVIPVTADTEQTITGQKTFTNDLFFDCTKNEYGSLGFRAKYQTGSQVDTVVVFGGQLGANNNLNFGLDNALLRILGNPIQFTKIPILLLDGKKFLTQSTVTAGSDNLIIAETNDGIKIVCSAPTNEQFGQLQELIADLSTKIDRLTDRVKALEKQIDGGVA